MAQPATAAPRIVFAGDRQIGRDVLAFILQSGVRPLGLMLSDPATASHAAELDAMCPFLGRDVVWHGQQFRSAAALERLRSLQPDYIICAQFPLIVPREVLDIPREGVLNLHPAYLPYNRGWHNSVWAILEKTPYGATLHFMNERVDMGDIVHQLETRIEPGDTGDSLYKRARDLELEVFRQAWPRLVDRSYRRMPQVEDEGSSHRRKDLFSPSVQELDLEKVVRTGDLLDRLRALTTNQLDEAAYFVADGRRYRVRVSINPDTND